MDVPGARRLRRRWRFGGGTPQPPPASITFSADQLTFTTTGPWDGVAPPASIKLTATVQGTINGTLYIVIQVNNPELVSVGNVLLTGQSSGEVAVTAVNPTTLSVGRHTGSIVVRTCTNDPQCNSNHLQGSPKTIALTYEIPTNLEGDSVMPRVVPADLPATLFLRGSGFTGNSTVNINALNADTVAVRSSNEIQMHIGVIRAGTHNVLINDGAVAFSGTVTGIPFVTYDPVFLPHPASGPAFVNSIEFDAERQALLVGYLPSGGESQIMRYAYSGGSWSAPTFVTVPGLQQVRLAPNGTSVLALRQITAPLTETVIEERDPVTLDLQRSTSLRAPLLGLGMAFTNDGQALVRMRVPGSGFAEQYVFGLRSRQFRRLPFTAIPFGVVADSFGSRGVFLGGDWIYDAASGRARQVFSGNSFAFDGNEPSASRNGNRIQTGTAVLDEELRLIGMVPSPSVSGYFGTATINAEGTRVYSAVPAQSGLPSLYTWDLEQRDNGEFVQRGSAVEMPGDPGLMSSPGPEMTISPDDRTVFIGGFEGIVVMPAPP